MTENNIQSYKSFKVNLHNNKEKNVTIKLHKNKNDYYLTFARKGGYNNHIHVILKNFNDNHNTSNICYMLKYLNKDTNEIVHSQEYKIIIYSNPKTVVKNILLESMKM